MIKLYIIRILRRAVEGVTRVFTLELWYSGGVSVISDTAKYSYASSSLHCHFIFNIVKHRFSKSLLSEDKNVFILRNQYHCCWWLGHTGSNDVSSNCIGLLCSEYYSFITRMTSYQSSPSSRTKCRAVRIILFNNKFNHNKLIFVFDWYVELH